MKRNKAFALILLGSGLCIGCKSGSSTSSDTTNTTNTPPPPRFCEQNCEERAFDLKVPVGKSLPLKPEEQNSLNQAMKERAAGPTHIEGTAVNGAIHFHTVPGPASITPNTPQLAVSSAQDPKTAQLIRIPLSPEAVQLARPRIASTSH